MDRRRPDDPQPAQQAAVDWLVRWLTLPAHADAEPNLPLAAVLGAGDDGEPVQVS